MEGVEGEVEGVDDEGEGVLGVFSGGEGGVLILKGYFLLVTTGGSSRS